MSAWLLALIAAWSTALAHVLGKECLGHQDLTAFITVRMLAASNHLPALPETRGVMTGMLLRSLPAGGVFINTGRGMSVVESELAEVADERPDLTFLLDVTDPEPPAEDSPLYDRPNIHCSSHIAGSVGNECHRLADWLWDEFTAWRLSQPLRLAVTASMLPRLA